MNDENQKMPVQEEQPGGENLVDQEIFDAAMNDEAPSAKPPEIVPPAPQTPKKRMKRRPRKVKVRRTGKLYSLCYIVVTVCACVLISSFCLQMITDVLAISKPDRAVTVTIPQDAEVEDIAQILKEKDLIAYPFLFTFFSNYENYYNYVGGTYVLNTNMGYTSMMKAMQKSAQKRETVKVTIPEGYTIVKIAKLLEENEVCGQADFLRAVANTDFDYNFVDSIPDNDLIYYRMEGYLFPDTYEFYKGDTALNVIKKLCDNFENKITPEMEAQMRKLGMTLHETITLASIIQGEASDTENMAMVSSVYHNRLNDKLNFPLLQADPTRKYAEEVITAALGDEGQEMADAYNSYTGQGLPPGPINNPGAAAIHAALYPEESNYYYFCSNLKTGQFFYAETLDQHNVNLRMAGLR